MRESKITSYKKLFRNTMIASVIGLGLTTQVAFADETTLPIIYHVYVDGEHIGVVDDQQEVENFIQNKLETTKEENNQLDYTYTIEEEISYVPETVFETKTNEEKVLKYLADELTVKVDAEALVVGEETVGYFASEEEAEAVIQKYKEKFVDKDTLKQLEENTNKETELKTGDTRILDVTLTEEVTTSEETVFAKDVLTVEQGVTLLEKGTLETKTYAVQEGDVLGSIASAHDLSLKQLLEINPGLKEDSLIKIGDELQVTVLKPFVSVVVTEEAKKEETVSFETEVEESETMYKGEEEVKQEGADGTKEVVYKTQKVNGKQVSEETVQETVTKEPVKEVIIKGTKVVSERGTGQFDWPAIGGYISSHVGERWGSYHKGLDIAGVSNRSILAADNGTIVSAGWDNGGYGNKIVIDHNNGYRTIYAHLDSIDVSAGQTVEKGQTIGVMGSTGDSTGIHLHFEVYDNGSLVNPATLY
ncbi:peptidoglycan DD-metalloendopeptidase family protein [Gracilibacillus marinus]|uniref:Peptidoglycan DD-metalloendopeptidase family protein n=1 Tax=Gracilibacillus marinus TaxID=630535 RepID=A0ABV8VXN5_9BACI